MTGCKKYAAMQHGAEALALVEQFNRGFQQWAAVSQRVIEQVDVDLQAASALSFGDSEARFNAMRDAIDKLGELEEAAYSEPHSSRPRPLSCGSRSRLRMNTSSSPTA